MTEHWIPFGAVETLVTIQAENLGVVLEPGPEKSTGETERLSGSLKKSSALFVCDSNPTTIELVRDVWSGMGAAEGPKVFSAAPKRIESAVADLKGRISTLPPPINREDGGSRIMAEELNGGNSKLFIATGRPDPLYGVVDAKVQAFLNWVALPQGKGKGAKAMEPSPFHKTESYKAATAAAEDIGGASFWTVIPRGGKVRAVMEDAPFDAIKNGFLDSSMPPARAMIVGAGGRGYDDTLSSAIRCAWGALPGLRRSGSLLLVAECSEGLGSTALQMMATGRSVGEGGRNGRADSLEEVFYLNKLKDEYDVLLLSGLPEVYAKSKLGLTTARGSGEAVGRLLNKVGRTGKVNIVTRAAECQVRSA